MNTITPSPEQFAEWLAEAKRLHPGESLGFVSGEIARLAYRAGADQELEACCEWLKLEGHEYEHEALLAARRPKAPSSKEQAHDAYWALRHGSGGDRNENQNWDTIRRALEALPDD
jgi:hypothetical protein